MMPKTITKSERVTQINSLLENEQGLKAIVKEQCLQIYNNGGRDNQEMLVYLMELFPHAKWQHLEVGEIDEQNYQLIKTGLVSELNALRNQGGDSKVAVNENGRVVVDSVLEYYFEQQCIAQSLNSPKVVPANTSNNVVSYLLGGSLVLGVCYELGVLSTAVGMGFGFGLTVSMLKVLEKNNFGTILQLAVSLLPICLLPYLDSDQVPIGVGMGTALATIQQYYDANLENGINGRAL
ncbi:MAG: hypothetical protein ACHP6I_02560 [Rickettsiales bacterium]